MSQSPVDDLTLEGYQGPSVVQFNVFLDNRVGRLLELLQLLEGQAVRAVGLSIIDSVDHAVIRLVTSRSETTRALLGRHRLAFSETEVLVVELARHQSLATLCQALLRAEVNISYAYPLCCQPHALPTLVLHTDEPALTGQLLRRKGFALLGEADLTQPGVGGAKCD